MLTICRFCKINFSAWIQFAVRMATNATFFKSYGFRISKKNVWIQSNSKRFYVRALYSVMQVHFISFIQCTLFLFIQSTLYVSIQCILFLFHKVLYLCPFRILRFYSFRANFFNSPNALRTGGRANKTSVKITSGII